MALVDKYGQTLPRYVAIERFTAKALIDEESKLDAVPENALIYYGAICNPPKNFALYKVANDGTLTLLTENFDDEET